MSMTRIWCVIIEGASDRSNGRTLFTTYGAACKSINKTWAHDFPPELEVTDKTRIGFSPARGQWVQLEAVMAHSEPHKLA